MNILDAIQRAGSLHIHRGVGSIESNSSVWIKADRVRDAIKYGLVGQDFLREADFFATDWEVEEQPISIRMSAFIRIMGEIREDADIFTLEQVWEKLKIESDSVQPQKL